ncbi:MAG: 60S ribosomal export protein NMD3 [Thermoplasmatota archaeon]
MLCLRCGNREQFANHLCEECILETVRPVTIPPVVQGDICRTCGRIRKGRSWSEPFDTPEEAAVRLAEDSVEVSREISTHRVELSVDHGDYLSFQLSGRASSVYHGVIIEQKLSCEVRLHPQTCPWCSKMQGNYYEAIIQLRGLKGLSDEQVEELIGLVQNETYLAHMKDPGIFISKEEKVRGGYDIYMGDSSFAKQLSLKLRDMYGGEHKATSSLFGRKDGRDLYRHTYLVRLPGFLKGDYLAGTEEFYKVLKVKKKVRILDLKSGRESSIDLQTAMSMRALRAEDVEKDLVVIMETENEVQVLHPSTMRPVDLVKRPFSDVGKTVEGALIDDELFLV